MSRFGLGVTFSGNETARRVCENLKILLQRHFVRLAGILIWGMAVRPCWWVSRCLKFTHQTTCNRVGDIQSGHQRP